MEVAFRRSFSLEYGILECSNARRTVEKVGKFLEGRNQNEERGLGLLNFEFVCAVGTYWRSEGRIFTVDRTMVDSEMVCIP